MTPEIGKWYEIRYSKKTSKRGYHGKAKCVNKVIDGWKFRLPNEPEGKFGHHFFLEKDVVRETTPEPTYEDLVIENEFLTNQIESLHQEILNLHSTINAAKDQYEQ